MQYSATSPERIASAPKRLKWAKALWYFGLGGIALGVFISYIAKMYWDKQR